MTGRAGPPAPKTPSASQARAVDPTLNGVEIRIGDSIAAVGAAAWNALLHADDAPFLRWEWLASLEHAGCVGESKGWRPAPILVYRAGELVAAAPAYLKAHSEGEFVFDWSWADAYQRMGHAYFPKLVLAVPFTPANGTRVLCKQGEDRAALTAAIAHVAREVTDQSELSSAHLLFPTATEAAQFEGEQYLRRVGVQYHFHNPGYRDFEDFLTTMPTKKRTQLRRERKELGRQGIELRTLSGADLTPMHAEHMHRFYAATVDKFYHGRRYLNAEFFRLIAERMPDALAWVFAMRGTTPIAGAMNVASTTALFGRYWGADEELPFLHFNVCFYRGIEDCIARKLTLFEPGAGGEHKRARGFRSALTHSAHYLQNARFRSVVGDFLRREGAAIRAHVAEENAEIADA